MTKMPGPTNNLGLSIGHLNVYHLFSKRPQVEVLLNNSNETHHIMGISETRLEEKHPNSSLYINNYTLFRKDRSHHDTTGHHGLALYIHDSISDFAKRREDLESPTVESLWVQIKHKRNAPVLICLIYRNPTTPTLKDWTLDFLDMMDNLPNINSDIILIGDFNINLDDTKRGDINDWRTVTSLIGLRQHIDEKTRVTETSGTRIDHIYSNNHEKISNERVVTLGTSDHSAIFCKYSFKVPRQNKKGHTSIYFRSMKNFDSDKFLADLMLTSFFKIYQTSSPDEAMCMFIDLFNETLDRHAPLKTKRVKHPDLPKWLHQDIINAMAIRDNHKASKEWEKYKEMRNKVNYMVKHAKKDFFDKLISGRKDTATIWRAMNAINRPSKKKSVAKEIKCSPEEINNHFINIPQKLLAEANLLEDPYQIPSQLIKFCGDRLTNDTVFQVPYITIPEVGQFITKMKNKKSMGSDNIPAFLLKLALPFIAEPLTYIYNLCIDQNIFPAVLKEAKVIPIPKTKDTSDPLSFRPISILSVLSKPLEKHIDRHLRAHLDKYNLLYSLQSGFRAHHSCSTALTHLWDSWLHEVNKKKIVGTVFLDFRKAFDLVNHEILLKKLSLYIPKSPSQELFSSYLSKRNQYVFVNGQKSKKQIVATGVPQGSILGPLLFLLYINDLPLHVNSTENNVNNELFADDASLYTSSPSFDSLRNSLQDGLNNVEKWCNANQMIVHPQKTKSMVVTTRQKQQINQLVLNLRYDLTEIEQVSKHTVLGIQIDSNLSWNTHVNALVKRLSKNTFLLSQLKKYATPEALKLFFEAHINSHINYASTLWDMCSQDLMKRLNSVHKRAIKILLPGPAFTTDEKYAKLDILQLQKQLQFNKLCQIHNIIEKGSPPYLKDFFHKASDRYGSKNLILPLPRIDLFQTSFSYSGSLLYNKIPLNLKHMIHKKTFRKNIRRFIKDNNLSYRVE